VLHHLHTLGRVIQRIAQIVGVDPRVGIHVHVFVGAVGQLVGRAAGRDLGQLFLFVPLDRLVGILDGPVVVGADRVGEVVSLLFSLGREVGRGVVHYRAGHATLAGNLRIVGVL